MATTDPDGEGVGLDVGDGLNEGAATGFDVTLVEGTAEFPKEALSELPGKLQPETKNAAPRKRTPTPFFPMA